MIKHKLSLLAMATTLLLSGCDGEKLGNSIAKRVPLALPEAGLYEANLLSRKNDKATPEMLENLSGLSLVYPKDEQSQRWGIWADSISNQMVQTNTQWVGRADQNADKEGIYPVSLTRNTERLGEEIEASTATNNHNLITFQNQQLIDLSGKEVKRWVFDLTRTGMLFSDKTPLYQNWSGHVAVTKIATKAITSASWSSLDDEGFTTNLVGKIDTTNNGGKLTVAIEFPAAGCTLAGEGIPSAGLSKLTLSGFGKCTFKPSDTFSPLENVWVSALAKAKDGAIAYTTVFNSLGNHDNLVLAFPEMNGFMSIAEKK
ncbi:hypothetical protein RA180_21470 [Aeromonas salmonicida]|uniref:hypothetical protein n=1 Tax=Aeromonas salmonicida TaxID=645 RepID=UPI0027966B36|nr:hypothetical protein [Aeromonas salmonicida]MDQ1886562.1 hypothetical protein [Aeromonas salmonicida]